MKNKSYQQSRAKKEFFRSRTKQKLDELQRSGTSSVVWAVNPAYIPYLKKRYKDVVPYLYAIQTRKFYNVHYQCKLIKDIHFAYKRGSSLLVRTLTEADKEILRAQDVRFREYKMLIILN